MTTTTNLRNILDNIARDADGYAAVGSRPNTDRMPALRAAVLAAGVCLYCSGDAPDTVAHLIPAGPRRMGYTHGNLAAAHRDCNDIVGNLDHSDILDVLDLRAVLVTIPTLSAQTRPNRDALRQMLNNRGIPTQK